MLRPDKLFLTIIPPKITFDLDHPSKWADPNPKLGKGNQPRITAIPLLSHHPSHHTKNGSCSSTFLSLLPLLISLPLRPEHVSQNPPFPQTHLTRRRRRRHPLRAHHSPRPLLRRHPSGLRHPHPQVRPSRNRTRRRPPRPHHRPRQPPPRHRLHPHPRRGPRRRTETLPPEEDRRRPPGSQRTPLRPGGGVVFGPKPKDWSVKINKKEKRLAISTAIASAAAAESTVVVEDFDGKFEKPNTKDFVAMMKRLGLDPKKKSMFLMTEVPDNVRLSSRNVGTLKMLTPRTLNLFDILDSQSLVLTKGAVEFLNERYGIDDDEEDGEFEQGDDADEGTAEEGNSDSSERGNSQL